MTLSSEQQSASVAPADRLITLPDGLPKLTLGWEVVRAAAKYLRQPSGKRAGQRFEFTDNQIKFLLWWYAVDEDGQWLYRYGVRRLSKGPIAHTTPVMTPQGWVKHGDLRVGDEVYALDGSITRVIDVKPEVYEDCYELTFRGGEKIVCTGSHRWEVDEFVGRSQRVRRVVTTAEMAELGVTYERPLTRGKTKASKGGVGRWRVHASPVIDGPTVDLPISPYVLGYWLGDGDSDAPRITVGAEDLSFVLHQLAAEGVEVGEPKPTNTAYRVSFGRGRAKVSLRELGVLYDKHIPVQYLRASAEQRWALLQGIVDSDGTVGKNGTVEISVKSTKLADDIFELAVSLGLMPTKTVNAATLYGKDCGTRTRIRFTPQPGEVVARLPRKAAKIRAAADRRHAQPFSRSRTIVSIRKVDTVPARCITVAHPSHQYLVGEHNIPTCNSGKSPFAAVLALAELCFPVRLKDFDPKRPGGCVGKPVDMPLVQIIATNKDQTSNTMRNVWAYAHKGSRIVEEFGLDIGKEQYYRPPAGKLEIKTSSAPGIEGALPTFLIADETEHWKASNGGHALMNTIRGNVTKSEGARILTTCNAWVPGEDSVAERDWEDWVLQQEGRSRAKAGTLYDARVIPADIDWANPDELRKGLEFVYDDCYWAPIDAIIDEIYSRVSEDPAKSTLDESMRKYGNRPTARSNAWVTKEQWERLAADGHTELGHQPYRRAKPGEEIVMFFDGSLSRDASALIGCCVEDGHVFTLGIWEPNGVSHDKDKRETVNIHAIDAAVEKAFQTYKVVGFFSDVKEWEHFAKVEWPRRYADLLEIHAVPGGKDPQPIAWDMRSKVYDFGLACELTRGEIEADEVAFTHDGNSALQRHVLNAVVHINRFNTESISKESPDSSRKIDAAVAMIGARMVRRLLLAERAKGNKKRAGQLWF